MRSLLEWCFAALPADRPASMNEVVRVLFNKCGASASEASVVVAGDNTGRAGSLYNLGVSLFEKAHDPRAGGHRADCRCWRSKTCG